MIVGPIQLLIIWTVTVLNVQFHYFFPKISLHREMLLIPKGEKKSFQELHPRRQAGSPKHIQYFHVYVMSQAGGKGRNFWDTKAQNKKGGKRKVKCHTHRKQESNVSKLIIQLLNTSCIP